MIQNIQMNLCTANGNMDVQTNGWTKACLECFSQSVRYFCKKSSATCSGLCLAYFGSLEIGKHILNLGH